jgi:hypothetical protein
MEFGMPTGRVMMLSMVRLVVVCVGRFAVVIVFMAVMVMCGVVVAVMVVVVVPFAGVVVAGVVVVGVVVVVVVVVVVGSMFIARRLGVAKQMGHGLIHAAGCSRWQGNQIGRIRQHSKRTLDSGAIRLRRCGMFKSDDISTGHIQFNRQNITINRHIQQANPMFVGP